MKYDAPEIIAWLQEEHSLSELCAKFPEEWEAVQYEITKVIAKKRSGNLENAKGALGISFQEPSGRLYHSAPMNKQKQALSKHIRQKMLQLAIKNQCLSVATGVTSGKLRFNLLNGYLVQKLLFSSGLERKPASLFWFRIVWPLIWQRKFLIPLVESKGIYCFYSKELITALKALIGSRSCLEIAAGDGTLTRFLKGQGIEILATDNGSWKHSIDYPDTVVNCDAEESLRKYKPEIVICSWPPANNNFERYIFKTKSVQTYILIASRLEFASGNWTDYRNQTAFSFGEDKALSKLVLPPELESAVYIFRRKM